MFKKWKANLAQFKTDRQSGQARCVRISGAGVGSVCMEDLMKTTKYKRLTKRSTK